MSESRSSKRVGEGRRGVSTGGFGPERGGREREEARSLQTEEGKKSVTRW